MDGVLPGPDTLRMHPRRDVPSGLLDLAAKQHRVVTTAQIRGHGMTARTVERLVRTDVWRRLDRGLTLVTNSPPTARNYLSAAALLHPSGLASGRTALALHGFGDLELPIEMTVPGDAHLTHREWLRVRRFDAAPGKAVEIGGATVVGLVDALISATYSIPKQRAADLFLQAVALHRCTVGELANAVRHRRNLPHRALLLDVLTDAAEGLHSKLEAEHERRVRRPHGLPRPVLQHRLPTGRIADAAFPEYHVIIELDGRSHIGADDRRRDNRHSVTGWVTLRFGWAEVIDDPCGVAAEITRALVEAGWKGSPVRCGRCASAG